MALGIAVATYNRKESLAELVRRLQAHTTGDYRLVVADDGSTDGTQEWVRGEGLPLVTGTNRGVAWNKNRGLAWLAEQPDCDPLILLEDDARVWEDGWNEDWAEAALRWGHVNYAYDGGESALCGTGTPRDPFWGWVFGAQCTGTSREAFGQVGYLDARFAGKLGWGREHVEWSERYRKALWRRWPGETPAFPSLSTHVGAEWSHSWHPGVMTRELWLEQLLAAQPLWRPTAHTPTDATLLEQEIRLAEAPDRSPLRRLRELYYAYVTQVSTVEMAISWELAAWLWNWLEAHRPESALDLGSGFSSVVLRLWERTRGARCRVRSADTDADWLERTRAFLERAGLSSDRLSLYNDWPAQQYDLVVYDLANCVHRSERLDEVAAFVRAGGTLVVDDVDYPPYEMEVSDWARARGWRQADLSETKDRFLRFSRLLTRDAG